jgi:TonB-dependent receptor
MHFNKQFFLATLMALFSLPSILNAQHKTTITGKVVDQISSKPLSNVTVKMVSLGKSTTTDFDGNFTLEVQADTSVTIVASLNGYTTKQTTIVVGANDVTDLQIEMVSAGDVVVKSNNRTTKRETVSGLINAIKANNTVSSGISQAQIKSLPIRNAADAVKTISGASIQDGKFVIIRGLADRYNLATLNGAVLSSTEPDRKTFAFDIFPSNIIDNIMINKAALPEMPAEFGGGLIQINTKDIADKNFIQASISSGLNTQTHNKDFYRYEGGKLDYLGIDDGGRKLPNNFPTVDQVKSQLSDGQKAALSTMLNTNWNYAPQRAPFNSTLQISGGYRLDMKKNRKLGFVVNGIHNQSFRYTSIQKAFYEGGAFNKFSFTDDQYSRNIAVGALANAVFQTSLSKISWKNTYNITSTDMTLLRNGIDNGSGTEVPLKSYLLMFKSNRLMNTQLSGEHKLFDKKLKVKWNANGSRMFQDIPDMKNLVFDDADNNGTYIANVPQFTGNARSAGRFFSKLDDIILGSSIDMAYDFKVNNTTQTVKLGGLYLYKNRQFRSRVLGIIAGANNLDELALSPDKIFTLANFSATKFHYDELTTASNQYDAISDNIAAYMQVDNQITSSLKASWGVRMEDFAQTLTFNTINKKSTLANTDFLPSANITYAATKKTNIRLSASQTVARPEFREVSIFSFYDFERNALIFGNENLKRTKITNIDARYEWYPAAGETVSFGAFYKYFNAPIEANTDFNAGTPVYSFVNADKANNYGIELDARKKLDVISSVLKNFTLFTNVSLISSKASFKAFDGSINTRPMQGQSNYVINTGISYENSALGIVTSANVNRIGRRIAFVGNNEFLPIWENPRTVLDIQIAKKLLKNNMEIKCNITDLFNQKSIFYQDNNNNNKYNNTDKIFYNYRFGTNISLSVSYNFL